MSTLRYFVVVSVSAAICAGGQSLANASSSVPSFSPSNESAEHSETISAPIPIAQRRRPVPPQVPPVPLPSRVLPTPVPPNLQPNPNPLQFPTRPEEVNIEVTQPLTLEQAIELARLNNRNLQVARLQLQQAQAQLREARAALYPTLDFQGTAAGGRSSGSELALEGQIPESTGLEINEESQFSINGALQLNYDLFTGGRRGAQIRAAEEGVRNAQLQVEALNEQTRLDITNAYYDLQLADEQVRIAESAVRNAQQSLRDALALEQAGLGTRFDTLRAQVQLANQNQLLVTNRAQQQVNRRQLAQLLSVPQSINVVAADPVEVAGLWNLSLEESIVRAFQNRAELQQQLAQRNIAEQQRQVALSAQRPQLSLFANYNVTDVFNDSLGLADGYQLGARVQLNIFDGGAARAQAAQQEANIAIAETQFADRRNQIRFQVEQGFFNLQANFLNIQTATLAVTQAAEALRLARLRFQAGVGTQTEVIDAENELTQSQGNQVRAVIDYNRSLATLIRAVSNLPPGNVRIAQ